MPTLEGHVAIVTGASRGIGKAIALRLAREGARVALAAREKNALDATAEELRREGLGVLPVVADVGNSQHVQTLVETTAREFGGISLLVNNAGIGIFRPLEEMAVEDFDRMWQTNVRGVFLMTRGVLPYIVKRGGGHIVNIASLAGKNSFAGGTGYCATKWALRGLSNSLMLEVRDRNIRVTTIFPGSVDTLFSTSGKKGKGITQPEDVADAVHFAVTAPARSMFSEIDVRPTRPEG
jgi:3-oxoacyl-[acyl-carrier protein] reductase